MLFHFSLYGFLKNQRFFEPFLYLVFLDKGLSFLEIGLLVGIRELGLNLMEIPSGILADRMSRRRVLQVAFLLFAISFWMLGSGEGFGIFALGMLAFGVADAMRSGSHKALIMGWLRARGRSDERTRFYGFTRSWSKIGSALSVLIGCFLVLRFESYQLTFGCSIPPCLLGALNLCFYGKELEAKQAPGKGGKSVFGFLSLFRGGWHTRGPVLEAALFEGTFLTIKDYLQPLVQSTAILVLTGLLALPVSDERATVILVAPVYVTLFLGGALLSRFSHRIANFYDSPRAASRALWAIIFWIHFFLFIALKVHPIFAIGLFMLLHMLQNVWKPIIVGRLTAVTPEAQTSTVLSLASQAKRMVVFLFAPILGWILDSATGAGHVFQSQGLTPLAVFGMISCVPALMVYGWDSSRKDSSRSDAP